MIRTQGLTRRFGAQLAVDALDLEVKAGEVLLLLGPNGAGKTTTLRMLLGLLPPTSGTIEIDGRPVTGDAIEVKRITGYLPEEWGGHEYLTGREYLEYVADLRDLERAGIEERIATLMSRFDLAIDRKLIKTYSDGMKRRLGLAAALLHQPRILLLDEPTAHLDPAGAETVALMIKAFTAAGGTVVLSTHIIDRAESIATEVAIMKKGRIVAQGSPAKLAAETGENLEEVFFRLAGEAGKREWGGLV
jgi:ABC-2 type transport system ATP-binding protein